MGLGDPGAIQKVWGCSRKALEVPEGRSVDPWIHPWIHPEGYVDVQEGSCRVQGVSRCAQGIFAVIQKGLGVSQRGLGVSGRSLGGFCCPLEGSEDVPDVSWVSKGCCH